MAVDLHSSRQGCSRSILWEGKTMKTRAFAVQPIPRVAENRAQWCPISGHSSSPWDGSVWAAGERGTKRILISVLILFAFATSCSSAKNGTGSGTSMQGAWTVTGNLGTLTGNETYQVSFVSSPCSVVSLVGTFSVQGPVCFIANNNTGQGSISGKGLLSNAQNTGEGVLIGFASDPVPANATFNLLFVLGEQNGNFVEFTGNGTVANGTMTWTGSCSPSTPMCQGL